MKLGCRLLHDRRGPNELSGTADYYHKQPRTSYSKDGADPDQPDQLLLQLEATAAGCRWLIEEWCSLRTLLEEGKGWQAREKLVVSRLLGKQPTQAVNQEELAKILQACHVIEPLFKNAFRELKCDMDEARYKYYSHCLNKRNVDKLRPADETKARAFLLTVVDDAIARLRPKEAELQREFEEHLERQRTVIAHGTTKTAEQIRRADALYKRQTDKCIEVIKKAHRHDQDRWNVVRRHREGRKQQRQRARERDPRLVMDETGTVRNAADYQGDVAAGLERFESRFARTVE